MRREAAAEAQRWLEQAREDLKWAKRLTEEGGYYLACFLAQQVAEKALKAFLYGQGEDVVLGHSVRVLSGQAGGYDRDLAEAGDAWGVLDGYYIPTRYPNGLPGDIPARVYNAKAAREAVGLAAEVVEAVAERLGL